jgi:CheY-like chemotaxis protein/HPt (histidine-containing phosphotransfer) domain-containing protein
MGQLSRCGMDPICAGSADEALSLMRQAYAGGRTLEVALIDHQMPGCDGADLGRQIAQDATLKATRMILLTSSGQRGDGQMFADIGFAGYLLKPVTQRDLTDCLMLVLAKSAETWHSRTQPIVTRHQLRAQRTRSRNHVLLAEDNLVNQKVALHLLEKLGCRVDVVADGQAAIDRWRSGRYDLILMDCQMPTLDGYAATAEIRRLEGGTRRIPIVALTAHAMKGAEQTCLDAGMDDYLSKPIDRNKLADCLDRHLASPLRETESAPFSASVPDVPLSSPSPLPSPSPSPPASSSESLSPPVSSSPSEAPPQWQSPVDWNSLLTLVGDEEFARELAVQYIEHGSTGIELISQALAHGDLGALGKKAHEIRGASANIRAGGTSTAAEHLEAAANAGDSAQLETLALELRREFDCAAEFLRSKVA